MVTENSIVIVEAKPADLTHGFVRLAAELMALDLWTEVETPNLYGAVTTGDDWHFGILKRTAKRITQDIKLYRVPENVEQLLRILIAVSHTQ